MDYILDIDDNLLVWNKIITYNTFKLKKIKIRLSSYYNQFNLMVIDDLNYMYHVLSIDDGIYLLQYGVLVDTYAYCLNDCKKHFISEYSYENYDINLDKHTAINLCNKILNLFHMYSILYMMCYHKKYRNILNLPIELWDLIYDEYFRKKI